MPKKNRTGGDGNQGKKKWLSKKIHPPQASSNKQGEDSLIVSERFIEVAVGGRISLFLDFWKSVTSDPWILSTVKGYEIPFVTCPPKSVRRFPSASCDGKADTEIKRMMEKEAIEPASEPYFVNHLFFIPKKSGGIRPILNVKPLNKFLKTQHFKMEQVIQVKDLLREGMWMAKIDLEDAYYSIPIASSHRKFLQFYWKGQLYQYRCLCFGLSTAPYTFTKICKPLLAHLRSRGIRIILYLDDALIISDTEESLRADVATVVKVLQSAGFLINMKKSILTPVQELEYLGVLINSSEMTFGLSSAKIEQINKGAVSILQASSATPRQLAQFIGLINSTRLSLRTAAMHFRSLQFLLISSLRARNWDDALQLSEETKVELQWWVDNIGLHHKSPIHPETPSVTLESDASMEGWGGRWDEEMTGGSWSQSDLQQCPHINSLELKAALLTMQSFLKNKTDCSVLLKMDNRSAVAYVNHLGGTRSEKLNKVALSLWEWCIQRRLWVKAEYIPGRQNLHADWESRHTKDTSDWKLRPDFTQLLFKTVMNCSVDLFASRHNHQLSRYWSRKHDPSCEGVNAFTKDWAVEMSYAFPPFCLIGMCLQKCQREQAELLLIAPAWPNQPWYALLLRMLFKNPVLLPTVGNLLTNPLDQPHPLQASLRLAAWPITGTKEKSLKFQRKLLTYSASPYEEELESLTDQHGSHSVAGELSGVKILFQSLFHVC